VPYANMFCELHQDTLSARLFTPHIANIKDQGQYYFVMDRYQMKVNEQGVLMPVDTYDNSMLRRRGLKASHSIMDTMGR
jgi:hypothetical protein